MVPILFFGLLYLGPYAVTGDDLHWLPAYVPWPAEQCIQKGYVGECDTSQNTNYLDPYYKYISPCRSLKCAWPKPGSGLNQATHGYDLFRSGRPVDGTLVGVLQACRQGRIVDITADRIPVQTGRSTQYFCTSTTTPPEVVANNFRKPKRTRKYDSTHRPY